MLGLLVHTGLRFRFLFVKSMESAGMDFLKYLENDMVLNILKRLDPAEVVRASILSHDWRNFFIGSEVCKQLCIRQCPRVADIVNVVNVRVITTRKRKRTEVGYEGDLNVLENHKVYTGLLHALQKLPSSPTECVKKKFSVTNYPSKGLIGHDIPETLIFKLKFDQCVITEIDIKPIREYVKGIQVEEEGYCAKSVRFRMGFPKSATKKLKDSKDSANDQFIWTYTSPVFPVNQTCKPLYLSRGKGQQFKLPEPVLCIGGFVMVELLGRVQMDEQKGPYYIRIHDVNVLGRSLSPAFMAKVQDDSGKFDLSYDASRLGQTFYLKPPVVKPEPERRPLATCACACSDSIY